MTRGAYQWWVFRTALDPTVGSEQAGSRPVIVISREVLNKALPVVAVLPLTRNKPGRRIYSTEVLIPAGAAGQPEDSIVLTHQVRTISRRRLGQRFGELADPALREAVRRALQIFLDLDE